MFIRFSNSAPDPAPPSGSMGIVFGTADASTAQLENILYIFEIGCNVFTIILNLWVFAILLYASYKKGKEYQDCFYIIMRAFSTFVTLNAIGTIIALMDRKNVIVSMGTTTMIQTVTSVNLVTYFASSLWLFYAGLSRMMAFLQPGKFHGAYGCWVARVVLTATVIVAGVGVHMYQKMCNIQSRYDAATNTVQIVADSAAEPIIVLIYVFPLTSLIFYAIAYNHLQKKRALVVSDKTKEMLDRAERKTLNIGLCIMFAYTISLVVHLAVSAKCDDSVHTVVWSRVDEIVSMIPQIAVPMCVFGYNAKLFVKKIHLSLSKRSNSITVSDSNSNAHKKKRMSQMFEKKSCESSNSTIHCKLSHSESHSH